MQIVNYFLFLCFMNLCNSFHIMNIKSHFVSRNSRHQPTMGCDYYITKDLFLYDYNDNAFSYIDLEKDTGYYWFASTLDEDEYGYEEEYARYKRDVLKPRMEPIVIYSNQAFGKRQFEMKYKRRIEENLKFVNKTWNDVNKIIKIENRYERD